MRRLVVLVVALIAAVGVAGFRPASASAQDTAAVAVNTKDGSGIFRLAFAIKRAAGEVVDNSNAAVAFASCTDCQTVAISIQIVLVTGDPDVVVPENIALAYNVLCTLCDTLASAYQWVLSTGGQVHFTAQGNEAIAEIRRELIALKKSGLTGPEIQARVEELMKRLARILEEELVNAGKEQSKTPSTTTPTTTEQPPTESTPTESVPTEPAPQPASPETTPTTTSETTPTTP